MKSEAVCSFSHQQARTQPTSGASNKHSLFHPALPFTGSTEPNSHLEGNTDSPVKLEKWWRCHGRLAIPFASDGYSEPRSIWWGNGYCINANWCIKEKPCLSFLCWSGNTVAHQTLESHKLQRWNLKVLFLHFSFCYQDKSEAVALVCNICYYH